jgi:hypothetical protein
VHLAGVYQDEITKVLDPSVGYTWRTLQILPKMHPKYFTIKLHLVEPRVNHSGEHGQRCSLQCGALHPAVRYILNVSTENVVSILRTFRHFVIRSSFLSADSSIYG